MYLRSHPSFGRVRVNANVRRLQRILSQGTMTPWPSSRGAYMEDVHPVILYEFPRSLKRLLDYSPLPAPLA